jgi:hypothetical protein
MRVRQVGRVKHSLAALLIMTAIAPPAVAEGTDFSIIQQSVVSQLDAQGYQDFTVGRTWLGRIVITARRGALQREIVLNARSGEILGDYTVAAEAGGPDKGRTATGGSSSHEDGPDGGFGGSAAGTGPPDATLIDPMAAVTAPPKGSKGGRD